MNQFFSGLYASLQSPDQPNSRPFSRRSLTIWFSFSLAFSLVYSILVLQAAFAGDYVIQDDARQHVFWMQRFINPDLFPNDLIADYFQSVAPAGYSTLYRVASWVGLHPFLFNKLLPLILGLFSTGYCFLLAIAFIPLPIAGFVSSLLMNQVLWVNDDVMSGTPRAFVYPLFLAFLYYLNRRSLIPCIVTILLQGLFYPQSVLVSAALLPFVVLRWTGKPALSSDWKDYRLCGFGLIAAVLILLPFALSVSEFSPVISVAEAQNSPEFNEGGRSQFFHNSARFFWLSGRRSGILPDRYRLPHLLYAALLLPGLLAFPKYFPLAKLTRRSLWLLPQIVAVSLGWFIAAHLLLFKLHLPSRYTQHTLRIVLCLAAAIALVILWDSALRWVVYRPMDLLRRSENQKPELLLASKLGAIAFVASSSFYLIFFPSLTGANFPNQSYVQGKHPDLYAFIADQPTDTIIASLSREADVLPSFTGRSVLVAREYGIPYHTGYFNQFQRRVQDLLNAQYSQSLADLQMVIQTYDIDFWLLDRNAFNNNYLRSHWVRQYSTQTRSIRRSLRQGQRPVLKTLQEQCLVLESDSHLVLATNCILRQE